MKNIKKRGVGMMVFGFIIIMLTLSAIGAGQGNKALLVITDLLGWALFAAGAFVRGKQKKEQKQLEKAMYQWAKTGSPTQPLQPNLPMDNGASFCPYCGAPISGNFCANCGARLR